MTNVLELPDRSPSARADRWQPSRAGIVNLWRYWDETFVFHEGRLLLRGANGSGKSMALELLLPFLLDANASPARLTSAAKSRGGLYERVMTGSTDNSRTGFAWVEFRRGDEVFTVGVRVRASTSTRKPDLNFFTTSLAVGRDLQLLDGQRSPLSRAGLVEAVGDHGRVHSSGDEHRTAVRQTLFPGFGADRYDAVITALLALRKEKLSQNLDLDKLSSVLSEALPPLDERDLTAVAEGFERLDRRRAELVTLQTEHDEIKGLARVQREYARTVLAAGAGEVRAAETARDAVTRRERDTRTQLTSSRAEATTLAERLTALGGRLDDIDIEISSAKESDAYRDGAGLVDLRSELERARRHLGVALHTVEQRDEERNQRHRDLEQAAAHRDAAIGNETQAADGLRRAAVDAGSEVVLDGVLENSTIRGGAGEATAPSSDRSDGIETLAQAWGRSRRGQVAEMRRALETHRSAIEQRQFAERQVREEEVDLDQRQDELRLATAQLGDRLDAYGAAVEAWAESCRAVPAERVGEALPAPPRLPADVRSALSTLLEQLAAQWAVDRRDIAAARTVIDDQLAELSAERDLLAAGRVVPPTPPPWRGDRAERPGAPLWRLVDLAPGVDSTRVGGLEAALVAAGLLDAWVSPSGDVDLSGATADIYLGPRPADGRTLAELLRPLDGTAVDATAIDAILASIAVADTVEVGGVGPDVAVALDGTFRVGAAVGRGAVGPPELLGAEAQHLRRLARLAELDRAMEAAREDLAQLARDLEAVAQLEQATRAELHAAPDGADVDAATRRVNAGRLRVADAEDRVGRARQHLIETEEGVRDALRALAGLGNRLQLPTTAEGLDQIEHAVRSFEQAVGAWARRERERHAAETGLQRAQAEAGRADAEVKKVEAAYREEETETRALAVRLHTLESTVGVEYGQVLERITTLDEERRTGQAQHKTDSEARLRLVQRVGQLEGELGRVEAERAAADDRRAAAHGRFTHALRDGLGGDASLSEPDEIPVGLTATLAAARLIGAALDDVASDPPALQRATARVQDRVHQAQGVVGGRVDLELVPADDGWWVLRTTAAGIRRSCGQLSDALARELAEGKAELALEEERLFEKTLAGSVRRSLAQRIRHGNELVDSINSQLGAVRTDAGGVQVRLRWDVDPEQADAVKAARNLLLRDAADLSADEKSSLQDFVRTRVDQARAELEVNAPWEARLRETLDYRAWHRFTLHVAHRDWDGFQPATARRIQRLSTGERSIALHLPMLASMAAHYAAQDDDTAGCPRLILLDELFAGVDPANRAQLFGRFSAWDLDAVFTSDHEWCQYASLDGIAIHHLHPSVSDADPVTSTRFTWDGHDRVLDPGTR